MAALAVGTALVSGLALAGASAPVGCAGPFGCAGGGATSPPSLATPGQLSLDVDVATATIDTPVHLIVRGAAPGARVRVRAYTRDAAGRPWSAGADFTADGRGAVDLAAAAPVGGDYRDAAAMGLLWSLHPPPGAVFYTPPPDGETVRVTAASGAATATRTLYRLVRAPGVASTTLTLVGAGFVGTYDTPAGTAPDGPGVLVFGGSGGGYADGDQMALLLAAHGYRALALAYFGLPGLPQTLSGIPLEYFERAVSWLAGRRGVRGVVVAGWSRGSEPAQMLGAYDTGSVTAVIALVPADVAVCAYPGCHGPAWTLRGQAIPYTSQFDTPYPTDRPDAVLPVERIAGPMLLACAGADAVWTSCPYQQAIVARRDVAHRYPDVVLSFPDAGHGIAYPEPYLPVADDPSVQGRTAHANEAARERLWPQILRFLGSAPLSPAA
jgi:dienelactone hydrolase